MLRPKEYWIDVLEADEQNSIRRISNTTEVSIDDMVVKSYKRVSHTKDLEVIFK